MIGSKRLRKVFRKQRIASMLELSEAMEGRSRASIFRDLNKEGYFSSYSHNGKYFTLQNIPSFDSNGLWHYSKVNFSQHGTLKQTVMHLVELSSAGFVHSELQELLSVRVHNVLLELVRLGLLSRKESESRFIYVSKTKDKAAKQLAWRMRVSELKKSAVEDLQGEIVVEILAEVIRQSRVTVDIKDLRQRLSKRGVNASLGQITFVLEPFEVKKTLGCH